MPENGVSTSKRCAPAKHTKQKCIDLEHGCQFKLGEKNNEDDAASVIEQYQDVGGEPAHKSIVLSFRLVGEIQIIRRIGLDAFHGTPGDLDGTE